MDEDFQPQDAAKFFLRLPCCGTGSRRMVAAAGVCDGAKRPDTPRSGNHRSAATRREACSGHQVEKDGSGSMRRRKWVPETTQFPIYNEDRKRLLKLANG